MKFSIEEKVTALLELSKDGLIEFAGPAPEIYRDLQKQGLVKLNGTIAQTAIITMTGVKFMWEHKEE